MKKEVAEHFIKTFTKENDIILDCFFWLGTTAKVCKKLNRKFIGVELEKVYYEMSKKYIYNNEH